MATRRGQQGCNPRGNLVASKRCEFECAIGLTLEPPVRLVEQTHDEPPRVNDAHDVLEETSELAVVVKSHRRGRVQQGAQREQRLERLGEGPHVGFD